MKKLTRQATKLVDDYVDQACDMLQDHAAGLCYGCCIPPDVAAEMAIDYWQRISEFAAETARELRNEREPRQGGSDDREA